ERSSVGALAARGVDEPDAVPHLRERRRVERSARLCRERKVQRQELCRGVDGRRRLEPLDAELAEALGRDEGVVRDDMHAEPDGAAGDLLPDSPETEHAERLPRELDASVRLALPAT